MPKTYKGSEILLEPPPQGWGLILYSDGFKAQVGGAKFITKEGQKIIEFYLMPYESIIKRFKIDVKKDLDRSGYCYKSYPAEMVCCLNTYDPSRRATFFSFLNWDGQETEKTSFFKGFEQANEIIRVKRKNRELKAEIETLKQENFLLKTNVYQFIAQNIDGLLKPLMPSLKTLLSSEAPSEEKR